MEFLKFIFSSFWIWLGFLILTSTLLYYIVDHLVDEIVMLVQVFKREVFKNNLCDYDNMWKDCKYELPKVDGLYYAKPDNTNSMYLCNYKNSKFTLSSYPDHEIAAIKWADYGAFASE